MNGGSVTWIKIYDEALEKNYDKKRESSSRPLRNQNVSLVKKAF